MLVSNQASVERDSLGIVSPKLFGVPWDCGNLAQDFGVARSRKEKE
jgi:hypothetical protein